MSQYVSSAAPGSVHTAARRNWWLFLVRGVIALGVGVIALVDPGATLSALILLLGAFFIVDGAFAIAKSFAVMRSDRSWWVLLLSGIVGIVAGVVVFALPGLTALTLALLIGFWAIVTGVLEVIAAISLRKSIRGEWLYVLFGIVSIVFGIFVVLEPGLGLAYLTLMIAIYGFVAGFALIAAGFRLRSHNR